ncbi:MAG: DciA family protein [Janthinobacterium lividum]
MAVLPTKRRKSAARPLAPAVREVLESSEGFSHLRSGVERVLALNADLSAALPDYLRERVTAAGIRDGVLVVLTQHGALAARLRQIEPTLVAHLQNRGWPVERLRMRVQPPTAAAAVTPVKQARLSATGLACLDALREQLDESPLKTSLERMVNRHAQRKPGE